MSKKQWEERIKDITIRGDYGLALSDGSKLEDKNTGARWTIRNQFSEGRSLMNKATVWDAEVTAADTLRRSKSKWLLILIDSQAAIAASSKHGGRA